MDVCLESNCSTCIQIKIYPIRMFLNVMVEGTKHFKIFSVTHLSMYLILLWAPSLLFLFRRLTHKGPLKGCLMPIIVDHSLIKYIHNTWKNQLCI